MIDSPALPESVKRNGDLFEIVFAFLLLPAIVVTMDHPPFFVGGKILLWAGTWFLVRRMPQLNRERVLAGVQVLRKPWMLAAVVGALALSGAVLAQFSGLERFQMLTGPQRWFSGAFVLPAFAALTSLPLSVLVWGYLPVRFENSTWLPAAFRRGLPVFGFAMLHFATGGLTAPVFAFAAGGIYWWAFKGRVPLLPAMLVHAVVGWMGVVGGLW